MQKLEQLSDLSKVTELVSGGVMTQAQMIQGLCHAVLSGTNPVSFTLQSRTPQLKVSHLPHILRPGRGSQPRLQTEDLDLGTPWLLLPASVLLGKFSSSVKWADIHLLSISYVTHFFCLFVFWLHRMACRIFMSPPGIEPGPQQQKHRVLTTGLPGNSIMCHI